MMPEGVEHHAARAVSGGASRVTDSMMPEGVEHFDNKPEAEFTPE